MVRRRDTRSVVHEASSDDEDETAAASFFTCNDDDTSGVGSMITAAADDEESVLTDAIQRTTVILNKAKEHVRQYQVQRDGSRTVISLVRIDIANLLPSLFHRKVLTIDMGQNVCVPNFEGEQPGNMYYLSPLTVLLFGVVNNGSIIKKMGKRYLERIL